MPKIENGIRGDSVHSRQNLSTYLHDRKVQQKKRPRSVRLSRTGVIFRLLCYWLAIVLVPMEAFTFPRLRHQCRSVIPPSRRQHNSQTPFRSRCSALSAPIKPVIGALYGARQMFDWTSPGFLVSSLLAPVVIAGVQGALAIVNFRNKYRNAPVPKVPCHGVVVVVPKDDKNKRTTLDDITSECLRLLVIGDSLAVGVGQADSSTPVMPEEIAKEISKGTGKAVYWTCCGESGASTPWIIRMLQQSDADLIPERGDVLFEDLVESTANGDGSRVGSNKYNLATNTAWREKLDQFRRLFDPENLRPYDIVVLVTGTNDLKNMLLPFLLDDEDKELRREIQGKKEKGLIEDVRLFMETLNAKMEKLVQASRAKVEQRVRNTLLKIRESAKELSDTLGINMDDQLEEIFGDSPMSTSGYSNGVNQTAGFSNSSDSSVEKVATTSMGRHSMTVTNLQTPRKDISSSSSPLFVLPGMPSRLVPTLRKRPLEWFAIPAFDMMDRQKKAFAKKSPTNILFVESPALGDLVDYEAQRGQIWEQHCQEDVLLSLNNIGKREGREIEKAMKRYYSVRSKTRSQSLSGASLFSVDGIHPREAAYKFWGRFLGRNIVQHLTRKKTSKLGVKLSR